MSEYELADIAGVPMGNFLASFTVFISIVTAYVVAAFTAGKRLSTVQVTVVNICFLIAAGAIGSLSILIFQAFLRRAQALGESEVASPVTVDFTWAVIVLYVILICASLIFMRSVRTSAPDD